jgi:hypothetical protein
MIENINKVRKSGSVLKKAYKISIPKLREIIYFSKLSVKNTLTFIKKYD